MWEETHMNVHKAIHKDRNTNTNTIANRQRTRERARSDQQHNTVIKDDRQGGLRAVAQTHM